MNQSIPKQFLPINGQPVLYHCLTLFKQTLPDCHIIISLPEDYKSYWFNLIQALPFIEHQCVSGGINRFDSVKNALKYVPDNTLVAIHDGVRPLVEPDTITKSFEIAKQFDSAIPVCKMAYSLRHCDQNGHSSAVNRNEYVSVNTPQCFKAALLKAAYQCNYRQEFTDDASVFEAAGNSIHLFEDHPQNIKITYPEDIVLAQAILDYRKNQSLTKS